MSTERLFIGLWPHGRVRDELAGWRDAWRWPAAAAPVPTEKLHMTLHFLGDVPLARIGALGDALALPFSAFELTLGRPALWHGGVAVLELDEAPAGLLALHHAIGAALDTVGVARDQRPYRPHVTMARRAGAAVAPQSTPSLPWRVEQFSLMASRGGVYEVVRAYGCKYA
jgi:2'-5' RNA ligase